MAFVLAVTNQKGGVGKTTTTVNLAAQLATAGYQVMLVDLDPQGNATSSLGIDKNSVEKTVYDVLVKGADTSEIVLPTSTKGLYVLPSNTRLAQAELELVKESEREQKVAHMLSRVDADVILIDCPPALGVLTINALNAADGVLIPVQAEYFALEGLSELLQTIQLVRQRLNSRLQIFGVVLTMFTKRTVLSEQVRAEVESHFGDKLFRTVIPRNIRLAEAPSFGRTIFEHDKWSRGAKAYKSLALEVIKRLKAKG